MSLVNSTAQCGSGAAAINFQLGHWTSWISQNLIGTFLALVSTVLVMEQVNYRKKKGNLPGRSWTIPIIGAFADSLIPTLENYSRGWATDLSVSSVFHIFICMANTNTLSRKVLNSPTYAEPCLVASAKQVLLPENWVFLHGKEHSEYRRSLNVLFTRRALSIYLPEQQKLYKKYFSQWLDLTKDGAKEMLLQMRDFNMETSLKTFCGHYISDEAGAVISEKYWLITLALELVNFPFAFPGTKVYNAIQARKIAMKAFEQAAQDSKDNMANGGEVTCLMDAWTKAMIDARTEGSGDFKDSEERRSLQREFTNHEIAATVLSFIFASQDATTSILTNVFQLLADHPDILEKVREEQYRVRRDLDAPITLEDIDQMIYTRAMLKEALRLLPPVIMVPYKTLKPFPLTPTYTVPKGTMLIPTFWPSLHDAEVYPEPDAFIPERWIDKFEGKAEANPKNYMVWGVGAHKCIGNEFATMHVVSCIATAAVQLNWEHKVTPDSYKQQIIACVFPKDNLHLEFTPRPKPTEL